MTSNLSFNLRPTAAIQMFLAAAAIILGGFWALAHQQTSTMIAGIALFGLLALYKVSKDVGICAALAFLILLGDTRRIIGWLTEFPVYDPLILVGFLFAIVISLPIFFRVRLTDYSSKISLALLVVMILEIFNPAQGGIAVGLSGGVFSLPPLLWFWIGRTFGNESLLRRVMYSVVLPLGTIAALLGIFQTFFGLLPWEQAWVKHLGSNYSALNVGGSGTRAFGFSPSSSEFSNLICMACIFCIGGAVAGRRALIIPMSIIVVALVLESSRGQIVHLLIAGAVAFAFKGQNKGAMPLRFVIGLGVGVGILALVLARFGDYKAPEKGAGTTAQYALAHQANGLAHPFDKKASTVGLHAFELSNGMLTAFKHPIGYGLGAANGAAAKFQVTSEENKVGSEFDLVDAFLSLGLPGGLLYWALVLTFFGAAYRYSTLGARDLSLSLFATLFAMIGDWFFPGEYGNGPILWLSVGCMMNFLGAQKKKKSVIAPVSRRVRFQRPRAAGIAVAKTNFIGQVEPE